MTEELKSGQAADIEKLISRMASGDKEALAAFYRATKGPVYALAMSVLGERHGAEDIMQETYIKVWTSAAGYKSQGKPLAWMFTIARNLCYMKFRNQKHESDIAFEDLEGEETGEVCPEIEQAADKLVLAAALKILKEEEREIVLLHATAGMKHREIAASLGMPLATVLSKYNRAMKKLENYLT